MGSLTRALALVMRHTLIQVRRVPVIRHSAARDTRYMLVGTSTSTGWPSSSAPQSTRHAGKTLFRPSKQRGSWYCVTDQLCGWQAEIRMLCLRTNHNKW